MKRGDRFRCSSRSNLLSAFAIGRRGNAWLQTGVCRTMSVAMRNEKGTISVSLVEEALHCAKRCGVDPLPLLEEAGISPHLLSLPLTRVSSAQYGALWNAICRALDDEVFGQDAHPMRRGSFISMCKASFTAA